MIRFSFLFIFIFEIVFSQNISAQNLSWNFDTREGDAGLLQTAISLKVNGKTHFIKTASGGFEEIPKQNFADVHYKIPQNTLTACSGFWGGLQNTLYVIKVGNNLEIREGFLDSEAPNIALQYKTIKKIALK